MGCDEDETGRTPGRATGHGEGRVLAALLNNLQTLIVNGSVNKVARISTD
jgi:hypothetical protein